jgi:subtilisin family serine protease
VLGRHILVVDLRQVPLGAAQQLLAQAAPQTDIDVHHLYRYAQSTARLYAADMIGLPATGGCRVRGLRVGIIDGPVNTAHPSLTSASVINHSVLLPKERHDNTTHGTGVASLIVGEDPSGALRGISPGARLYAAAAFAKESGGAAADVERIAVALDWLLSNKVRLINLSFAGPPNRALEDTIQAAAQKGAVMIAAAGNKSSSKAYFPAASASVIAVTAVDAAGRRYRKANQGSHIEFAAPGVDIYVAKSKGANYASGTSFAAPMVTGIAAHAMSRGAKSANSIRSALRKRSQDLGQAGRDSAFGWGLVKSGGC